MPPPRRRSQTSHVTPTSGLAVTSLILGIIGFCGGITAVVGVILGHLGLSKINRSAGTLGGRGFAIAGLVLGYLAIVGWATSGFFFYQGVKIVREAREEAERQSYELFEVEAIPVPAFPALPVMEAIGESGVRVGQVELNGTESTPGAAMSLRIYLPPGDHEAASLPCVLTAPAGTNLLSGSGIGPLDEDSYHEESLPYAEAGMAVVMYSIDGAVLDEEDFDSLEQGYDQFVAAAAGVVNGRNALEFALERMPMVDPNQIFVAGHSSAASLALLMSVHEPRLAGAIAYAPAIDLEAHFSDLLGEPALGFIYSNLDQFVRRSSPMTHVEKIQGPLFLFFAEDDSMASPDEARDLVSRIESNQGEVDFELVPRGGHYRSMIDEGIPSGIEWIERRLSDR